MKYILQTNINFNIAPIQKSIEPVIGYSKKTYLNRLIPFLRNVPHIELLLTIWKIDQMQSDSKSNSKYFLNTPPEAYMSDITSPYLVRKWELESLLSLFYCTAIPFSITPNPIKYWQTVGKLFSLLRAIENAEHGTDEDVFLEMHRIGQRQFLWQKGITSYRALVRYVSIFNCVETNKAFQEKTGISVSDFMKTGYIFHAQCKNYAFTNSTIDLTEVGISDTTKRKFLNIVADAGSNFSKFYRNLSSTKKRIVQVPSKFRTHPIITLAKKNSFVLIAPIPELIFLRVTQGLFYDFVEFDHLRQIIGNNFVEYCKVYADKTKNTFQITNEFTYKKGKNTVNSVDFFLLENKRVSIAIECKTKRMTHPAQFGPNPIIDGEVGFYEIAKAILQLWRYIADADQNLINEAMRPSDKVLLLVLTLDNWFDMPTSIIPELYARANKLADKKNIPQSARKRVAFASISCFENLLERADNSQFKEVINAHTTEKYENYMISNIYSELFGSKPSEYPFREKEIELTIPWLADFKDQSFQEN